MRGGGGGGVRGDGTWRSLSDVCAKTTLRESAFPRDRSKGIYFGQLLSEAV